jgi:hypothetical protein
MFQSTRFSGKVRIRAALPASVGDVDPVHIIDGHGLVLLDAWIDARSNMAIGLADTNIV